jgi:hypothetical protein
VGAFADAAACVYFSVKFRHVGGDMFTASTFAIRKQTLRLAREMQNHPRHAIHRNAQLLSA